MIAMSGLDQLRQRISALELTSEEAEILVHVANDGEGWTLRETPGILAECTGYSHEVCSTATSSLLADGWLTKDGAGQHPQIHVNWGKLGVSSELRGEVQARKPAFINLGAPRSRQARNALTPLYEENHRLYVSLSVTPPERLVGLDDRVRHGRPTTLLIPGRRYAGSLEHPDLYAHTLDSWRKWLERDNRIKNVELRIVHRSFWFIQTSALSRERVRFAVYSTSQTTSAGELLSADRDSSIYRAVSGYYRDALLFSTPWWRLYKKQYISELALRLWPAGLFVLAIVAAVIFNSAAVAVIGGAVAGAVGNSAVRQWTRRPKLFES